jgi:hypothetical protein
MGQVALSCLFAAAGLFAGVPMSVAGCFLGSRRQRWLSALGIVLNLAILPVSMIFMLVVCRIMNLTLEP